MIPNVLPGICLVPAVLTLRRLKFTCMGGDGYFFMVALQSTGRAPARAQLRSNRFFVTWNYRNTGTLQSIAAGAVGGVIASELFTANSLTDMSMCRVA